MKSLDQQLNEYRTQYAASGNKIAQFVGIPAIIIGALLGLSWISVSVATTWHITFAWIAVAGMVTYYFFLDMKKAIVMAIVLIIVNLICTWIAYPSPGAGSLILFLILLGGGIGLQFMGGKQARPAVSSLLNLILIAPLYLVLEGLKKFGLGKHVGLDQ